MKNDLTCAVVRDLLPSYAEGLTSPETNEAVERHLTDCPDCTARLTAMQAPEEAPPPESDREVDYLKTVKRKTGRRVVLAILCTVLLIGAVLAAKVFLIGSPAQAQELSVMEQTENDGILRLWIATPASATAYWGWKVETSDGVADISARSVLVSPLFREGGGTVEVPLEGVREVRLCGRVVWQEGTEIPPQAAALWEARTPYVGKAPAVKALLDELFFHMGSPGLYTLSLQTASEPFGLTLDFSQERVDGAALNQTMQASAPLILALVDNLGKVSWSYTAPNGLALTTTVSLTEIDGLLPDAVDAYNAANGTDWTPLGSIKDYAASPAALWQLTELAPFYPEV